MNRIIIMVIAAAICALTAFGCSNGAGPASLPLNPDLSATAKITSDRSTVLWGFYDVYIDLPTQTATAVPNRQVMFTANVVNFLNSKTTNPKNFPSLTAL